MTSQQTLTQWQADEAAMRSTIGPTGVATIDQLRERCGIEFLEAIKRGDLPHVPIEKPVPR